MPKKLALIALVLASCIMLCSPAYALLYFAPRYIPGLVFVDKPSLLYERGDFSAFSWAISRETNPGDGAEPAGMRKKMLGPPDDFAGGGEPDNSYLLGKGGWVKLGYENLFAADGILNTLPGGEHNRNVTEILEGIDVAIFQDSNFAGGVIYGKEPGKAAVELVKFGDNILDGKDFNVNKVAILLDLDQIEAAQGKQFKKLKIRDRGGDEPYFELDAAGVKVIPEPTTLLLSGLGLIGLAGGRIRKRFKERS